MPVRSREYEEFLREERQIKKLTLYERLCSIAEKFMPLRPWKSLSDDYNQSADFAHLKITAAGAFALTIFATLLTFFVPLVISIIFNFFSLSTILLPLIFCVLVFFYFYTYPTRYATTFRIRAS